MATVSYANANPCSNGPGYRSNSAARMFLSPLEMGLVTTGNRGTITTTNLTPIQASVGGRPAINLTNSGSTATDVYNFTGVAANIIAQPNQSHYAQISYYSTTVVTTDVAFGFGVVGTNIINSDPTDHIMIRKLAADTSFSLRSRKSSGTASIVSLPSTTLTIATWWDFAFEWVPSSTAGLGAVRVFAGSGLALGAPIPLVYAANIATQSPDTVAMAPFCAVRAGSAANIAQYFGEVNFAIGSN